MTHLLRSHLVRSQLLGLNEVGRSKSCRGKIPSCHLCKNMKDTCTFKSKHLNEVHKINTKYNCNSIMAVHLIEFEKCGEQYTGSTKTKFRSKANNYYASCFHIHQAYTITLTKSTHYIITTKFKLLPHFLTTNDLIKIAVNQYDALPL